MSDKPDNKKEAEKGKGDKATAAEGEKAAKGGLLSKTPVLLGIAMVLQSVILFAGLKMFGGGAKPAVGAEVQTADADAKDGADKSAEGGHDADAKPADTGHGEEASHDGGEGHDAPAAAKRLDKKRKVELKVVDFKASNKQSGRMYLYDVSIVISVHGVNEEKAKSTLADNDARVKDRIRTIVAQSPPEKLAEPGLETLRRQVKYQLDQILGDNIVDEVYVPRCIPFPVE
jgi:flagellar basal body-associated protein FliL